jgi:hypothetical protein
VNDRRALLTGPLGFLQFGEVDRAPEVPAAVLLQRVPVGGVEGSEGCSGRLRTVLGEALALNVAPGWRSRRRW